MPLKTIRGNQRRKDDYFILPTGDVPSTDRCVKVWIPDDPQYLALLGEALRRLQNGFLYQRDPTKKGADVARGFIRAYAAHGLRPCEDVISFGDDMQLRQNGCVLEYSLDCEHWYTLYDPTDCIAGIAGQPGGGGIPGEGECREYDVTLRANDQWLCPIPVSEGYTVEVTNAVGGWYDGATLTWRCPDGRLYILGACGGATTTAGGDPINTAPHMTLLAKIDTTGPEFFEILTGVWTIPAGAINQALTFQANDSDLTDNSGSISFHLKVCTPPPDEGCPLVVQGDGVTGESIGGGIYRVTCPVNANSGGVNFANCLIGFSPDGGANWCCKKYHFTSLTGWNDNNDDVSNQGEVQDCDGTSHVWEGTLAPENWITYFAAQGYENHCVKWINVKSLTAFTIEFSVNPCS